REGAAARRAGAPARGVGGAGVHRRPRHLQGVRQPLRERGRDGPGPGAGAGDRGGALGRGGRRGHDGARGAVRRHRRDGATVAAPSQPVAVQLTGAKDYDPIGGDGEHPELVNQAIDGNRSTDWHTSTYDGGNLGKAGVGLYVNGSAPVSARQLDVYSSTPGWR